ncbi:hypothetical protein Glove_37g129 [Diversispora epigaea]|uniref:Uncharacterized protein n=1 Tax=Diversispora epigaea TaxID=1348612 RepID=A0A397JQT3_9GLOM|nr:hypothetical protein Glove_37g129 [Diversispora epigaea]
MSTKNKIRPLNDNRFPLSSGKASKGVQKYEKRGNGQKRIFSILEYYFWEIMTARNLLTLQEGVIPKVEIIFGNFFGYGNPVLFAVP